MDKHPTINICEDHQEYPVPLIYTFAFIGSEYWCPYCGFHGDIFAGTSIEATVELRQRAIKYREFSRDYLHARGVPHCSSTMFEGKRVKPSELPEREINRLEAIRKAWNYGIKIETVKNLNMKRTKLFFDTEFTELTRDASLISIGLISETGVTFYAELNDYNHVNLSEFVHKNVLPRRIYGEISPGTESHEERTEPRVLINPVTAKEVEMYDIRMHGSRYQVKQALAEWLKQFGPVELWGDVITWDHLLFVNLFGSSFDVPGNVLYMAFDLATVFREKNMDPDFNRQDYIADRIGNIKLVNGNYPESQEDIANSLHNALYDAMITRLCYAKLHGIMTSAEEIKQKAETEVVDLYMRNDLVSLLEVSNDRVQGYARAANEVTHEDLKKIFQEFAATAKKHNSQLRNAIHNLKGETTEATRNSGKVFRSWMDIKAAITGRNRSHIISAALFEIDSSKEQYDKLAEKHKTIPDDVVTMLGFHQIEMNDQLDRLTTLK